MEDNMFKVNSSSDFLDFPPALRVVVHNFINEFDLSAIDKEILGSKDIKAYKCYHKDYPGVSAIVYFDEVIVFLKINSIYELEDEKGVFKQSKEPALVQVTVPRDEISLLVWGCFGNEEKIKGFLQ